VFPHSFVENSSALHWVPGDVNFQSSGYETAHFGNTPTAEVEPLNIASMMTVFYGPNRQRYGYPISMNNEEMQPYCNDFHSSVQRSQYKTGGKRPYPADIIYEGREYMEQWANQKERPSTGNSIQGNQRVNVHVSETKRSGSHQGKHLNGNCVALSDKLNHSSGSSE
jgi:hypothetical protein